MTESRQYDTVSFDVRDNAMMLFFAKTTEIGEIDDYLLLMRTIEEDFDESIYLEINDKDFGGHNLIREASMTGNILTLHLHEPAQALGGVADIVLTWSETTENLDAIEIGAFRVLGDMLVGGNA
ncbi:MAG: hypothetical protein QNJ14_08045 [Woeseiaceae bacterium]|nr:hypothetical protein [Woeseiaceae bacterium]